MKPKRIRPILIALACLLFVPVPSLLGADPWLDLPGGNGPGKGKHIVFIAAEEAYRSEESMPVMAKILSRMGFRCTVLFAIDPAKGTIDPTIKTTSQGWNGYAMPI